MPVIFRGLGLGKPSKSSLIYSELYSLVESSSKFQCAVMSKTVPEISC